MKMYADGKHDKLFKHGTMEENTRKEAILRELNNCLARKHTKSPSRGVAILESAKERKLMGPKRRKLDGTGAKYDASQLEGESFRSRVLELIESKIQFDMEQRIKENELREQEFELQKRFLEYLQSK